MDLDLRSLVGRLGLVPTRCLEAAAGTCVARGQPAVTPEHLLLALLERTDSDAARILAPVEDVRAACLRCLESPGVDGGRRPVFAPSLVEWLREGWLAASLILGHERVRSGSLLLALAAHRRRLLDPIVDDTLPRGLESDLRQRFAELTAGSAEADAAAGGGSDGDLERYCTDLTRRAREGRLDPVLGREREIRQCVDILCRRRKNNPILVGDPGVGKTAVVEGLALEVSEGRVPEPLAGVRILTLDLALLQAGASVKGEFEERLRRILAGVQAAPMPTILFIDEAHMLVGAGGQAGTGDAANLLKPALARGELRTIAATTWGEYRRHIEKDPALARRFQPVAVDEPSADTVLGMLRGLRERYESTHGVLILDDALRAAVELGSRHVGGRQHPDKGIDLMDTAAARVRVAAKAVPSALADSRRVLAEAERAVAGLRRDQAQGLDVGLAEAESGLETARSRCALAEASWNRDRALAEAVSQARMKADSAGLGAARQAWSGGGRQVPIEVDRATVAAVVADWTGIPVGNLMQDEAQALLEFEHRLGRRLIGQDHALAAVGAAIRAAKAGIRDPRRPIAVFLLVGPSGVGKTETARGTAEILFGSAEALTTINLSEYQERHAVARLVGAPPGYVGYGEGGILTESVRRRPWQAVLLDEIEKADPHVLDLFYQVFDAGVLADGEGRKVDFSHTVIFLASNLGSERICQLCHDGRPDPLALIEAMRPTLARHLKPALLGRMTVIPYFPLAQVQLAVVARLKLAQLAERMRTSRGVVLEIGEAAMAAIAARCADPASGARAVDRVIEGWLVPRLAEGLLARVAAGQDTRLAQVAVDGTELTVAFR